MSAQTTPIGMDLSLAAQKRNNMVFNSLRRLEQLAHRAMYIRQLRNDEFVVVCIKVDSPSRDIVDILMPNADWQPFRDRGQEPIAQGTTTFGLCRLVAQRHPELALVLLEKPADGKAKCIALDEGGCSIYEIDPVA